MCREGLYHTHVKKEKIHEPSSYKSQHIMPAYKGGERKHLVQQTQTKHTAQESRKPSPNSQLNSNNFFFFQRLTITKKKIKHPCTKKKNHAVCLVCAPAKDPKWESSLKHADAGGIQASDRHKSGNNQMNQERNIVLRFKPYSLLASLITRTIN